MGGRRKTGARGGAAPGAKRAYSGRTKKMTSPSEATRELFCRCEEIHEKECELILGEAVEKGHAAAPAATKIARRAAICRMHDAKKPRDSSERPAGVKGVTTGFLLSMTGLPRTNAVTGRAPEEAGKGWRA